MYLKKRYLKKTPQQNLFLPFHKKYFRYSVDSEELDKQKCKNQEAKYENT